MADVMINALDPRDYQEEQERERLREAERVEKAFEGLYTDKEKLNQAFNSPEGQFALQYSNDPEEVKARSANWELLSHRQGRDLYMAEYPIERDKFALEKFGVRDVNDQQLYDLISKDFTHRQEVRTATQDLYNKAIKTGFEDTLSGKTSSWIDQYEKWKETNKELLKGEDEWAILNNSFKTMRKAQDALGARGSVAAQTWQTLNAYADGKATEADLHQVGLNLAKTPAAERQQIYSMIRSASATQEDPKDFASFIANVSKSTVRGFGFAEAPGLVGEGKDLHYEYVPLPTIERQAGVELARAERMPDGPAKQEAIAAAREKLESVQVIRELKSLGTQAIDPVAPIFPEEKGFFTKSTAEKTVYGISGSLGYMTAAAANPLLGLMAIANDEYDKFRVQYPNVPPAEAQALTLAYSIPQAILERFGVLAIANKLPVVSTWIKGIEGTITRRLIAGATGVTTQVGQEFAQDAISAFGPPLIAAFREDMPDADWDKVWQDYKDTRPEVFFAAVFFGALSIGTLDLAELQSPEQIMTDRFLTYMGYNAGQRNEMLTARTPQEAQAILQRETPRRTKSAIANGIKIQEADMAAAERLQNDPTMPTMTAATLPDGTREYSVTRPAPQETASVTVVDPKTGLEDNITMEAGAAKATAKRQSDAMATVIDCLIS